MIARGELRTDARGSVTLVNGTARFSCCSNNALLPIHWHFARPDDDVDVHVIYNDLTVHADLRAGSFDVRFDGRTGCSLLTVGRVRLSDAGTYSCLESNTARRQLHFDLVVFGQYRSVIIQQVSLGFN